ncbi:MAG: 3-keto-5-aminohexanoate cleavage protein, partial [Gordonia sp. (in: high G+C Gram-positive bacteria)]
RLANELGREVATGKEARDIYRIGEWYADADETLAKLGYAPNRQPGQVGFTGHA